MIQIISKPHDRLFKTTMQEIEVARAFFETNLPAEILSHVDLNTLEFQDTQFIDNAQQFFEADIVYSVQIKNRLGYFILLAEHQSRSDHYMAFRLLGYQVRLMEKHHKASPKDPLPIVYPIVIYTGKSPWNAPYDFFELYGEDAELARGIFMQPYQLIDVHRIDDAVLRAHPLIGLIRFAFKHRRARNARQIMQIIFPWIRDLEKEFSVSMIGIVLNYIFSELEINDQSLFIENVNECLSEELRDHVMTLAQQYQSQGWQKGKIEGKQEGKLEIARQLFLCEKMDLARIVMLTGLTQDEVLAIIEQEEAT